MFRTTLGNASLLFVSLGRAPSFCLVVTAAFHEVSVYPKKELPFFILFTAGLCSFTAILAMLTHQFPELMGVFAKAVSTMTCDYVGQLVMSLVYVSDLVRFHICVKKCCLQPEPFNPCCNRSLPSLSVTLETPGSRRSVKSAFPAKTSCSPTCTVTVTTALSAHSKRISAT